MREKKPNPFLGPDEGRDPDISDKQNRDADLPTNANQGNSRDIGRREFMRKTAMLAGGFLGAGLLSGEHNTARADEAEEIKILNKTLRIGAFSVKEVLNDREEKLPTGITQYLLDFQQHVRTALDKVPKTYHLDTIEEINGELDIFTHYVTRETTQAGGDAFHDAFKIKPLQELVSDLTQWATVREARARITHSVFSPEYRWAVINYLKKDERDSASSVVRIMLKRAQDAREPKAVQSNISHLRDTLERYQFQTPAKNESGDLELWVPMFKDLKNREDYWKGMLEKIEN